MKLYTFPSAPNPRRVHLFLAEKGLEIPFVHVDILKRENRTPEFLSRVNPLGGLPVLELDDGSHLAESVSICRYLEAIHPETPLFGSDAKEMATIDMWIRRLEFGLMVPLGLVWIHGSPLTRAVVKEQIPAVAEQNRRVVARTYAFLEAQLTTRPFIAGDYFCMADILALTMLDFAIQRNALAPAPGLIRLGDWHARVSSRPAVAATR